MAKAVKSTHAESIDDYIAGFPEDVQKILKEVRAAVKKAAPKAKETIRYAIPTFTLNGNLVSFAAWKNHIGFYPVPREIEEFKEALSAYDGTKSTAKFPMDQPLPLALIGKIVKFKVRRNLEKAATKAKMK